MRKNRSRVFQKITKSKHIRSDKREYKLSTIVKEECIQEPWITPTGSINTSWLSPMYYVWPKKDKIEIIVDYKGKRLELEGKKIEYVLRIKYNEKVLLSATLIEK